MDNMNNFTDRTKIVKQDLAKVFPYKDVSVTKGRGTASSWTEVVVTVPLPQGCRCNIVTVDGSGGFRYRAPLDDRGLVYLCAACYDAHDKAKVKANKAINGSSARFGIYYPDTGYEERRRELLVDIKVGDIR